ncbi:MAG: hypothetical protein ABI837_09575 [Acidobacteriota bacterium]
MNTHPSTHDEALSLLDADTAKFVAKFRALGLSFDCWVADGQHAGPHVAVYQIRGGHLASLEARLLVAGWLRYGPELDGCCVGTSFVSGLSS